MNRPTIERIRELFHVSPELGTVHWRRSQGRAGAGALAGRISVHGYREVTIDRQSVYAHSLIFFVAHGWWPERIDHINGRRSDNRIANLREADAATNSRNRTHWVTPEGLLGATRTPCGRWLAQIIADGVRYHLGVHDTEEEAHQAYVSARERCAAAEAQARHAVLLTLREASLVNEVSGVQVGQRAAAVVAAHQVKTAAA